MMRSLLIWLRVRFSSPVDPAARLQRVAAPGAGQAEELADLINAVNDNVDRLNGRLFSYQDYAVIGRA